MNNSLRFLKQIILFAGIMLAFVSLSAQNQEQDYELTAKAKHNNNGMGRRFTVGVAFGPGIDWLQPKTIDYTREKTVFNFRAGVLFDVNFTQATYYYFSTGLFFHYDGGRLAFRDFTRIDSIPQAADISRRYKAYYLTIPTGIKLKTPDFSNFVIAANFGMYHSFLLSSSIKDKVTIEAAGEMVEISPERIGHAETRPLKIREAIYAGLGLEYIIRGDFRAFFYANFSHTFTNFFNGQKCWNGISGEKEVAKLNSVEFIVGLNF